MKRRELLTGFATIAAAGALGSELQAQTQPSSPAGWPIKPLPFDPKKLKGLSEKLLVSHHDNNYAGAVKRLNLIQQQLGSLPADAPPYQYGSLKREELIASNSMALHELYFANLGGTGPGAGATAELLKAEYGTLDAWERDFRQ